MQRGSPQGIPSSHLIYPWSYPRCALVDLHLAVRFDYKQWVLDLSPGIACTSHGVPRKRVRSRNFLRWAPINLCFTSHWHTAALQKLKRNPAIVPATTHAENVMESKPDEVGWSVHVPRSLTFIWIQRLSKNSQSVVPTKTDYAVATVKEVLTLAQSAASVIPVPFLKETISVALKIIQLCEVRIIPPLKIARRLIKLLSGSIGCGTKSQRAAS